MHGLFEQCSRNRNKLVLVLMLLALGIVVRRWVWMPVLIDGNSMLPVLHTGQLVGVNKIIYLFESPQRGEVVGVWTGKEWMIKRILALPNEEVEMRDGIFYVDGSPLVETYPHINDHSNIARGRIGPNQFVLVGDNRPESLIAIVDRKRIIGRLLRRDAVRQ
jgi:signal peptidase I